MGCPAADSGNRYLQAITPLAPTINNMIEYHTGRNNQSLMGIRKDTLSQLLNLANIKPGGRYLLCDDTGGLILSALLERMGGFGRILCLVDIESAPAWPIVESMNFEPELVESIVASLNWAQTDEDYVPVEAGNPDEEEEEEGGKSDRAKNKEMQKMRKRMGAIKALNDVRDELHSGNWDGYDFQSFDAVLEIG